MSTRIKSAAVAIVIAVILLIAHGTFLFNIAVGAISALAIYEIFRATKMTEHKYQTIACCAFAFVDAFMPVFYRHGWLYFFSYKLYMGLFVIAMCLLYLKEHTKFQYTEFFFMLGVGILLPYSFSTLVTMAGLGGKGVFMIVLTLAAAWLAYPLSRCSNRRYACGSYRTCGRPYSFGDKKTDRYKGLWQHNAGSRWNNGSL